MSASVLRVWFVPSLGIVCAMVTFVPSTQRCHLGAAVTVCCRRSGTRRQLFSTYLPVSYYLSCITVSFQCAIAYHLQSTRCSLRLPLVTSLTPCCTLSYAGLPGRRGEPEHLPAHRGGDRGRHGGRRLAPRYGTAVLVPVAVVDVF
jgi:hypothetical protein